MKRRIYSDHSIGADLKKRSSSLFSIATIVDDVEKNERNEEHPFLNSDEEGDHVSAPNGVSVSSASSSPPSMAGTDSDGFFIDDDEEEEQTDEEENDLAHGGSKPSFFPIHSMRKVKALQAPPSNASSSTTLVAKSVESTIAANKDLRTGVVFEAGSKHFDRQNRYHKERPLRVASVHDALTQSEEKFQERCTVFQEDFDSTTGPERAFLDDEDFLRVHLPGYMKRLDNLSSCNCCDRLDREAEQFKSIYFTKDSVSEAKAAATSLCKLVTRVSDGDLDNGFAVIRPPGHHAEPGLAGGYCVINNVAVAASYAKERLGMKRILIVDWDVHHGNGTQSIFLNDPNVLYFSVHRWHGGNFFPFLQHGGATNVGVGKGAGFNINVGWSRKGMGDDEYLAVWEKVLMPVAREFDPDLVLISAGFDAADGDMGECHVTPECFGRLTRSLMTLASGRVVGALEGGYVRSVLAKCVAQVVSNLLDRDSARKSAEECRRDLQDQAVDILEDIDPTAKKNILATIAANKAYWSCFQSS